MNPDAASIGDLRDDQRRRWLAGDFVAVESYLASHPQLAANVDQLLDLVYSEFCLAEEVGRNPQIEDYLQRFAQHRDQLTALFELHRAVQDRGRATLTEPWSVDEFATQQPDGEQAPDTIVGAEGAPLKFASLSRDVPGYEILGELGRGGMGVVYQARHLGLKRIVALKMILAGGHASRHDLARFQLEAEAVARLQHPNIVQIFDIGQHDGRPYFSMEFVDGGSLAAKLQGAPQPPRAAAQLVEKLARAMHLAHQRGIVHRDLKPANVLLMADGEPKINDFGLAKHLDEADITERTATGTIMGTPAYMAPEQAMGQVSEISPRTDVYSLGAILYCLLTGRPPFQSSSLTETLRQVVDREPLSPRQLSPEVDRDLETICLRCLEKSPAKRLACAEELADELHRFQAGEPIRSRRIGRAARVWRWCKRKPLAAGSIAMAVVLLIAVAVAGLLVIESARTQRLADLTSRFQADLDRAQLSTRDFESLKAIAGQIETLSPSQAIHERERLYERLAQLVDVALRQPKLDATAIVQIESGLALLESNSPALVGQRRATLDARRVEWKPVFELTPPFAELATVFAPTVAYVEGTSLALKPRPGAKLPASRQALTLVRCEGNVQCEAVFDDAWQQATELGLALNAAPPNAKGKATGYDFVLRVASPAEMSNVDPSQDAAAVSFQNVRASGGFFVLTIRRNGGPLQKQTVSASAIPSGRLKLRATRDRDRLTFQAGSSTPIQAFDPFPLAGQSGAFAVWLPPVASLGEFRAQTQTQAVQSSGLEEADRLHDEGKFDEAVARFEQEAIQASLVEFRQEARYKQAVCLTALNRTDEAVALLESLMVESGDRWPPLAGCQLWLLRLRQKRPTDADAVFEVLSSRFRFEQLAALIPSDAREEILAAYFDDFQSLSKRLTFNPDRLRNIHRTEAVDMLLSPDGRGSADSQFKLFGAYQIVGDFERALQIGEQLKERYIAGRAQYLRLLRLTGKPQRALEEINRWMTDTAMGPRELGTHLSQRAFANATLDHWDRVENDVNELFRRAIDADPNLSSYLVSIGYLMRGFVHEHRGDLARAQQVWREGLEAVRTRIGRQVKPAGTGVSIDIEVAILGSLAGELTDLEAAALLGPISSQHDSPMVKLAYSIIDAKGMGTSLRESWQSPRGRDMARAFAFDTLPSSERVRIPPLLAGAALFRDRALAGDLSPDQDVLIWETLEGIYAGMITTGRLTPVQAAQLSLSWKGTTNLLGWDGVAPTLDVGLRANLGYLMAHRSLRAKDKAQAEKFLRAALKDAPSDSPAARLATADLELLKANQGRVMVHGPADHPVQLAFQQAGEKVIEREVTGHAEIDLPTGAWSVSLAKPKGDFSLSKDRFTLTPAGRQEVVVK